jgi:hypothetical protein
MSNVTSLPLLPEIFVGKEIINRRIKGYLSRKHPQLSQALSANGTKREDTRSIWYSKDHVTTWLEEMQLMQADGMRVYFGAYDENEGPANGQLCLLVVLTREGDNGVHKDIILEEEPGFDLRVPVARNGVAGEPFAEKGTKREYNYGSPCPPLCDAVQGGRFPQ